MTLDELILALRAGNIVLRSEGERLHYDAPKGAMRPELLDELRRYKPALLARLRERDEELPLVLDPQRARWPSSAEQLRMWLADQIHPQRADYNMPLVLRWQLGPGAVELGEALLALATRHPILSARLTLGDDVPVQVASADGAPELVVERITDAALAARCDEEAARPFTLTDEPPMRARLFELEGERRALLLTVHHIAADARSLELLVAELAASLGFGPAEAAALAPATAARFGDYTSWAHARAQATPTPEASAVAWAQELAGLEPLALGRARGEARDADTPELLERRLDAATVARLDALATELRGSRFALCCAALALVCARWTGQLELPIATPMSTRRHAALSHTVGPLLQTVALRVRVGEVRTLRALAAQVSTTLLAALERGPASLTDIARAGSGSDLGPLLRLLVTARGAAPTRIGELELVELVRPTIKADLQLTFVDADAGLQLRLEYGRAQLGDAAPYLADALVRALGALAHRPDDPLHTLSLLDEVASREQLRWGQGPPAPAFVPIVEAIVAQAHATPDAIAIAGPGFELSYTCVVAQALRLARWLGDQDLGPEARVAVCLERGPCLVPTILGVLAAGLVYVPLEPRLPPTRLRELIARARAELVLTEPALSERLGSAAALALVGPAAPWLLLPPRSRAAPVAPAQLAYLIYTSGSSGAPKGVAITHRSASALAQWAPSHVGSALSGVFATSSVAFDLSIFELLTPLCSGGTVILARDALAVPDHPQRARARLLNTVPSAAAALVEQLPPALELVNLAGEPLRRELVARLLEGVPHRRVFNLYGPAEDTTYSTAGLAAPGRGPAPLGAPLPGTRVYLLDHVGQLAGQHALAELYLAGAGLARGYEREPGATAAAFLPDPHGPAGARMYASGDLVRRRGADVVFEARRDRQLKLRGVRIEPGEIEATLAALDGVAEIAVLPRPHAAAPTHLLALCRLEPGLGLELEALREHCRRALPVSHQPRFALVDALPRTASGKLELRALAALAAEHERRAAATPAEAVTPPRDEHEHALRELWAELLELPPERLCVDDDLFALGAHSLLVPRFLNAVQTRHGVRLSVRAVFEQPSVRALARHLATARSTEQAELLALLDEVEGMSDEEVERLLARAEH